MLCNRIGSGERMRVLSWATRSPVVDLIVQRLPQTLWVVGLSYLFGVLIAIPIGVISAYRQYSWFDQIGTFISMVGYSVPTVFTGVLLIVVFSSYLQWFPSIYDTTLVVNSWDSFVLQVKQMFLPVLVLTLFNVSQISRFVRASMLDNLNMDYVRTARAKGVKEKVVLLVHVLRNSLIPVVTVIGFEVGILMGGSAIVEIIFGEFAYSDFRFDLTGVHPALEYCTQYNETTFAFISRLLEREGIHYYFLHNEDGGESRHVLVFTDNNRSNPALDPDTIPYHQEGLAEEFDAIQALALDQQMRTRRVTVVPCVQRSSGPGSVPLMVTAGRVRPV